MMLDKTLATVFEFTHEKLTRYSGAHLRRGGAARRRDERGGRACQFRWPLYGLLKDIVSVSVGMRAMPQKFSLGQVVRVTASSPSRSGSATGGARCCTGIDQSS